MFDKNITIPEASPLPSTAHELNIDNITKEHCLSCSLCVGKGLHPSCYFNTMRFGQQLVYVGILIDTVKMVLRFDAVQSRGFKTQLVEYISMLKLGRHVDAGTVHHVCGSSYIMIIMH